MGPYRAFSFPSSKIWSPWFLVVMNYTMWIAMIANGTQSPAVSEVCMRYCLVPIFAGFHQWIMGSSAYYLFYKQKPFHFLGPFIGCPMVAYTTIGYSELTEVCKIPWQVPMIITLVNLFAFAIVGGILGAKRHFREVGKS